MHCSTAQRNMGAKKRKSPCEVVGLSLICLTVVTAQLLREAFGSVTGPVIMV